MPGLAVGPSQEPWEREDLAQQLERKEATCCLHAASYPADSRHEHPADINISSPSLQHGHTLWADCLRDAPSLQADRTANPIRSSELIRLPPCPSRGCTPNASELHCSSAATENSCLGSDRARPGAAACPAAEAGREAHRPSRAVQLAVKVVALLFLTSFLLLFATFHWYIHQTPPPGGPGRRGSPRRPARVPPAVASVEFLTTDFGDFTSAHLGTPASDDSKLLSWEHLAAEHGSAAVVIIGDGDARPRTVVDASERPVLAASAAVRPPRYSALTDAGVEDEEVPVLLSQAAFHWGKVQPVLENSTSEELSVGENSGNAAAYEQPSVGLELEDDSVLTQLEPGVQMRQPTFAELSALSSKFGDASLAEDQITDRLQLDGVHALRQAAGMDAMGADKEVSSSCSLSRLC